MDRSGAPRDPAQPLEDWYEIGFEPGLVLNGMDGEKLWTVKATVFLLRTRAWSMWCITPTQSALGVVRTSANTQLWRCGRCGRTVSELEHRGMGV